MNQQTRMILVEGIPFTGKSTTSEYITTQLTLNGYPAHWVSEGMLFQNHFPHVLTAIDQAQTLSEAALHAEWSTFIETVRSAATVFVVDSALSYAAVAPLLEQDWPLETIRAELRHIAGLCAPLQPRVIHLTGDAWQLVPASIAERGQGWHDQLVRQAEAAPYQQARGRSGVEGATSLMHDSQVLLDAILSEDQWPTLTLNVSAPDRPTHRRSILTFLGLDELQLERPTLARSVLQACVGSYATDDPDRRDKLFFVRLEGDTLVMYTPNQRYGPLLPVSETRFHLEATPVDIEFTVEQGLAQHLTVFSSNGKTYVYRRA